MAYRPKYKNENGMLTDLPLEAEIAVKLKTARTIGLSGVAATAKSFNGTSAITIPITGVPSTLLTGTIADDKIESVSASKISGLSEILLNTIYPVGSVKRSTSSVNPSEYLGGNWLHRVKALPTAWKQPETTPLPLTQSYWNNGLGKSIIDMKGKTFRFAKTNGESLQVVASGVRHISPGSGSDVFIIENLLPFTTPGLSSTLSNLVKPWNVDWDLDKVAIEEDENYYYMYVINTFLYYDPSASTPNIRKLPLNYLVNCNSRKQYQFEYAEDTFYFEWLRIS